MASVDISDLPAPPKGWSSGVDISDLPAPPKPAVYDEAEFRRRLGRAPDNSQELANFVAQKGVGFAGDPGQLGMSVGDIAANAVPAAAQLAASGVTGAALAIPAAARYGYNLLTGEGHDKAKELAAKTLAHAYQPTNEMARGVMDTVGQVSQAPIETYQAAAYNAANALNKAGAPTDPEATGQMARNQAEGAALLSPLVPVGEAATALARNPGAVVNGARAVASDLASRIPDPEAAPVTAAVNPSVAQATRIGVKLTPEQANSGIGGRVAQSLSGSAKLERDLSKLNAKAVNDVGANEIGLSADGRQPGAPIAPSDITKAKEPHLETYDAAASAGDVPLQADDFSGVTTRGTLKNAAVEDLRAHYAKMENISAPDLLTDVAQLRADASKNIKAPFAPAQNQLGFAQRKMADALEGALGRKLDTMENPPVSLADFRAARQSLAKIHSVEDSLDDAGNVSARALNKQLDNNVPLSGGLKDVAETYGNFSRSMQDVAKIKDGGPFSVLDPAIAAVTGGPAALAGHAVLGPIGGAAAMVARPIARAVMASDPYQRAFIQSAKAPAAGAMSPAYQAMVQAATAARAKAAEEAAMGATLRRTVHAAHQAHIAQPDDNKVVSFQEMLEAARRRAAQGFAAGAAAQAGGS